MSDQLSHCQHDAITLLPHVCPNCGAAMTTPGSQEEEIWQLRAEILMLTAANRRYKQAAAQIRDLAIHGELQPPQPRIYNRHYHHQTEFPSDSEGVQLND